MNVVEYKQLLRDIQQRPGLYGLDGSMGQYLAFIEGLDAGSDHHALQGFKEWLAARFQGGSDRTWAGLVYNIAFQHHEPAPEYNYSGPPDPEHDKTAAKTLFLLLDEFFDGR